ncbi:MAG: hypothetical protein ACYC7D_05480 [Nitrososphaerales archaeon]
MKPRYCPNCGKLLVDNHGWIMRLARGTSYSKDKITMKTYEAVYDIFATNADGVEKYRLMTKMIARTMANSSTRD